LYSDETLKPPPRIGPSNPSFDETLKQRWIKEDPKKASDKLKKKKKKNHKRWWIEEDPTTLYPESNSPSSVSLPPFLDFSPSSLLRHSISLPLTPIYSCYPRNVGVFASQASGRCRRRQYLYGYFSNLAFWVLS
jgi:hypothetical protein